MPPIGELASLGLGAVLAGIVLYWKRIDDQRYADRLERMWDRRDEQQERLLTIIRQNSIAIEAMTNTISALASFDRLSTQLKGMEAHLSQIKRESQE